MRFLWTNSYMSFLQRSLQFSHVWLFVISCTAACQASLSIPNSLILLKLMSIELVMPSNHVILCPHLLLLPSVFPNIRVFSSESVLSIRWPKFWSFSFSLSPSHEYSGLIDCLYDWHYSWILLKTFFFTWILWYHISSNFCSISPSGWFPFHLE